LDASLDFNRWNEADDDELENTLSRSSSSPFSNLTSNSQPSTPPFSTINNPTLGSQSSQAQRNPTNCPFTTSTSQFVQLPPRMTNNTLVFSSSPLSNHQVQFLGEPLSKSWQPQSGLLNQNQNINDNQTLGSAGMSPLNDVLSSLPSQNLGVQNLTLPSTTLDLSDIKWGILDPTVSIKRSGSTDSPVQEEERLTIQEDL